jgi:hypothetical protein
MWHRSDMVAQRMVGRQKRSHRSPARLLARRKAGRPQTALSIRFGAPGAPARGFQCARLGALDRRPQLAAALAKARKARVPVVVMAKLCRLSRDVALRHPFRKRHPRRPANCAAILVNRRPRHPSIANPLFARVRTNQAAAPASRLQP